MDTSNKGISFARFITIMGLAFTMSCFVYGYCYLKSFGIDPTMYLAYSDYYDGFLDRVGLYFFLPSVVIDFFGYVIAEKKNRTIGKDSVICKKFFATKIISCITIAIVFYSMHKPYLATIFCVLGIGSICNMIGLYFVKYLDGKYITYSLISSFIPTLIFIVMCANIEAKVFQEKGLESKKYDFVFSKNVSFKNENAMLLHKTSKFYFIYLPKDKNKVKIIDHNKIVEIALRDKRVSKKDT